MAKTWWMQPLRNDRKNFMRRFFAGVLVALFPLTALAAQPWQEVTVPTVAQAASSFADPPKAYGAIHWAIWGGPQTRERIISDIDKIAANGGGVYMINNSQRIAPKYLSPEYMDLVKAAVQECKKQGMKVWIETDCGYPDGFAGGLISSDYPQLGMQGIIPDAHCTVAAGETLDIPLPADCLGILANARPAAPPASGPAAQSLPIPADGTFKTTLPRRTSGELTVALPSAEIRYTLTPGEPFTIPIPPGTKSLSPVTRESNAPQPGAGGRGRRGGAAGGRGAAGGTQAPATRGAVAAGGAGRGRGAGRAGGGGGGGGGRGNALQAATIIPLPTDGHLQWTAPAGDSSWELTFVRHIYRSSPTRNDNGDDGGATKDGYYSLIDYLDPNATATFMKLIHETYAKAVGDEFGKTVLGFRGDEPDYTGLIPWSPRLLETFKAQKGYDLTPYIAGFFGGSTPDSQRAKADYYDVWSGMFRDNFYKPQQEWCRARGMDYMVHINHEETMMSLVASEGSFFRNMRYVGVPGVDNLNQIGPGIVADFPKLAASAAHLFGRSQVWEEEGGTVGIPGKFVFDYQLVRGINFMNIRGMTGANAAPATPNDPTFGTGWYYSRAQHLLSIGRPAAQVAFYHPTDSYWMGDREADAANVKLAAALLDHQIDFDHIDEDALTSTCTLEGGGLKNMSGQVYRAVILPSCSIIHKGVLERLRAFAAAGGKVICIGRTPTTVVDKTFLHPEPGAPDLSFATLEPAEEVTARVVAALPPPDVKFAEPCTSVKYIHRTLQDGDVYFFFNESDQPQSPTATLSGNGQVQVWDAATGTIAAIAGAPAARGSTALTLTLASHEGRFIVVGPPAAAGN
jgi:hypothetical protein